MAAGTGRRWGLRVGHFGAYAGENLARAGIFALLDQRGQRLLYRQARIEQHRPLARQQAEHRRGHVAPPQAQAFQGISADRSDFDGKQLLIAQLAARRAAGVSLEHSADFAPARIQRAVVEGGH